MASDDVRDALGLYQQYLVHDVLAEDEEVPTEDEEQSVHSEEVQMYGEFMRTLITNEDDGEEEDLDVTFGMEEDRSEERLSRLASTDDSFIGKTVVTESPSKEEETDRRTDPRPAQDLLVEDAKTFLVSNVTTDSPRERDEAFQWNYEIGAVSSAGTNVSIPTIASPTDTFVSTPSGHERGVTRILDGDILPTYSKSCPQNDGTPDTKSSMEDDSTVATPRRMYDVPWTTGQPKPKTANGSSIPQKNDDAAESGGRKWLTNPWTGRDGKDDEVPSSPNKSKSRFWAVCCDEVVDLQSHGVFRVFSTVYFLWVLLQILPVVVKAQVRFWTIPNPYFGFILASTLALHSFLWRGVSVFVLETIALTLQLVLVHMKDFRWRWVRLIVCLMPVVLCLAHVFLVFVDSAGQCVVNTKEGWVRTIDDACIICTGDNRPLTLDKYRDPCLRPSTRYSSDIWGENGDYCGSETNNFCFYSYAGG